jgi:hypothetical protein
LINALGDIRVRPSIFEVNLLNSEPPLIKSLLQGMPSLQFAFDSCYIILPCICNNATDSQSTLDDAMPV